MKTDKYIYHCDTVRHRMKYSRDILGNPQIETFFEVKEKRWYGHIWIEIKDLRLDLQTWEIHPENKVWRRNPAIFNYQGWGSLEIWDTDTFDLSHRLKAIADSFSESVKRGNASKNRLIKQISSL